MFRSRASFSQGNDDDDDDDKQRRLEAIGSCILKSINKQNKVETSHSLHDLACLWKTFLFFLLQLVQTCLFFLIRIANELIKYKKKRWGSFFRYFFFFIAII